MINRRNLLLAVPSVAVGAAASPAFSTEVNEDQELQVAHKRLLGKWKSDAERTMKFLEEETKMTEKAKKVMSQLLGKIRVEYDNDTCVMSMPSFQFEGANREVVELDAWEERVPYQVLGATDDAIAIKLSSSGEKEILVVYFEDDRYWVYTDLNHGREYFKRFD